MRLVHGERIRSELKNTFRAVDTSRAVVPHACKSRVRRVSAVTCFTVQRRVIWAWGEFLRAFVVRTIEQRRSSSSVRAEKNVEIVRFRSSARVYFRKSRLILADPFCSPERINSIKLSPSPP